MKPRHYLVLYRWRPWMAERAREFPDRLRAKAFGAKVQDCGGRADVIDEWGELHPPDSVIGRVSHPQPDYPAPGVGISGNSADSQPAAEEPSREWQYQPQVGIATRGRALDRQGQPQDVSEREQQEAESRDSEACPDRLPGRPVDSPRGDACLGCRDAQAWRAGKPMPSPYGLTVATGRAGPLPRTYSRGWGFGLLQGPEQACWGNSCPVLAVSI